jgi:hypothetical protein
MIISAGPVALAGPAMAGAITVLAFYWDRIGIQLGLNWVIISWGDNWNISWW